MIQFNFKKIFSRSFWGEEKNIKSDSVVVREQFITPTTDYFDTSLSKKRMIISIVVMMLMIFVQEAVFNNLRIFGVKPFFPVVLLYIFAFVSEFRPAMYFGAGTGLYIDIVYGRFLGFYGIILMYAAVVAALISMIPGFKSDNHKGKIGFMALFAPIYFFAYSVVESFFARFMLMYSNSTTILYVDYPEHMFSRILPASGYNFLVFIVIVWPVVALWRRIGPKKTL